MMDSAGTCDFWLRGRQTTVIDIVSKTTIEQYFLAFDCGPLFLSTVIVGVLCNLCLKFNKRHVFARWFVQIKCFLQKSLAFVTSVPKHQ